MRLVGVAGVLVAVLLLCGCIAQEPKLTPEQWSALETRAVDAPRDEVLRAAASVMLDHGYFYLASDHAAGIVTGEWIDGQQQELYRRNGGMRGPVVSRTIMVWVRATGPTKSDVRVQHSWMGVRSGDEKIVTAFWTDVERRLLKSAPLGPAADQTRTLSQRGQP